MSFDETPVMLPVSRITESINNIRFSTNMPIILRFPSWTTSLGCEGLKSLRRGGQIDRQLHHVIGTIACTDVIEPPQFTSGSSVS